MSGSLPIPQRTVRRSPMRPPPRHKPDFALGPLDVWIRGREFEGRDDYWDANWLQVEAKCSTPDSSARMEGPIVFLSDLQAWIVALRRLVETVEGEALLGCTEPNLSAVVRLGKTGSGELVVTFRNELRESHEWTVPVDQSHLPGWIASLEAVLVRYPIRGQR